MRQDDGGPEIATHPQLNEETRNVKIKAKIQRHNFRKFWGAYKRTKDADFEAFSSFFAKIYET